MPLLIRSVLLLLIWWCCLGTSFANIAKGTSQALYWVSLSDKEATPYSVLQPEAFLSPRALERRARQGIAITEEDLPVDPAYLQAVAATGATIRHQSKWLNSLTISADTTALAQIKALPFVTAVEYVGKFYRPRKVKKKKRAKLKAYPRVPQYYGYSDHQIRMLNGQGLHYLGFRGEDMLVAVFDGGFNGVDVSPFYDSLRYDGRLWQGKDFVDIDEEVFEASSHGAQVLSCMAAQLPGLYVGSAPDATYTCCKTEDTRGEFLIEECNWVAAAEYADSLGVDVINSSLGYTTFNDTSMNYTYADMNGRVSRASQAADIAFSKGMLVVNSAGNSGNDPWKYIGTPADAFFSIAVGATDYLGNRASFSSFGPTADGRIKPNVSAMGQNIAVTSGTGHDVLASNGTSFASPLLAGMIASLWSALPHYSSAEMLQLVQTAGSNFPNPNNELGYGIPDFLGAFLQEQVSEHVVYLSSNTFLAVVPPTTETLQVILIPDPQQTAEVVIRNAYGKEMWSGQIKTLDPSELIFQQIPGSKNWPKGFYSCEMNRGGVLAQVVLLLD